MNFYVDKNSILKSGWMLLIIGLACNTLRAQNQTGIAVNQIGFFPDAPKVAIVSGKTGSVLKCIMTKKPVVFLQKQQFFLAVKTEITNPNLSVFLTYGNPSYI